MMATSSGRWTIDCRTTCQHITSTWRLLICLFWSRCCKERLYLSLCDVRQRFFHPNFFLQWDVGEARRDTMLPSIFVCFPCLNTAKTLETFGFEPRLSLKQKSCWTSRTSNPWNLLAQLIFYWPTNTMSLAKLSQEYFFHWPGAISADHWPAGQCWNFPWSLCHSRLHLCFSNLVPSNFAVFWIMQGLLHLEGEKFWSFVWRWPWWQWQQGGQDWDSHGLLCSSAARPKICPYQNGDEYRIPNPKHMHKYTKVKVLHT